MTQCQCSLRIRLVGDGCRYCQPQEYIDRLHDNAKDDSAEIESLEARVAGLEAEMAEQCRLLGAGSEREAKLNTACRRAGIALAAATERDPSFQPDYEALDALLSPP